MENHIPIIWKTQVLFYAKMNKIAVMAKLPPINIKRLDAQMLKMGINQEQLAKLVGIHPSTISDIRHGRSQGSKHLPIIAKFLKCSVDYLVGLTDDPEENLPAIPTNDEIIASINAVSIAELDLRMGMGAIGFLDENVERNMRVFPEAWVRNFTKADPSKLFFIKGIGDSMFPTLQNADILLVDTSQINPVMNDLVWAITYYGGGQIKRLRRYQEGYKIMSDNQNVSDEIAMDGELHVIGRVIAVWREI